MRCSVVTLCSLPVVCCLPGTYLSCELVEGQKADHSLPVRAYVQNNACRTKKKQGNRLIHYNRGKNFEGLPRAPEGTDRARTSTDASGRTSRFEHL